MKIRFQCYGTLAKKIIKNHSFKTWEFVNKGCEDEQIDRIGIGMIERKV